MKAFNYTPKHSDLREQVDWEQVERDLFKPAEPAPAPAPSGRWQRFMSWLSVLGTDREWAERQREARRESEECFAQEWSTFRVHWQPGDVLWLFNNGAFRQFAGREGYAILRQGEVVASIITKIN